MSRAPTDLPERLLTADATDFERRVIESALQKKPSPAAAARMASALGVTVTMSSSGTAAGTRVTAADAAASKATVGVGASTAWPWVSLGVLGLVVGAVVGARAWHASRPHPTAALPALIAPSPPPPPDSPRAAIRPAGPVAEPSPGPAAPAYRGHIAPAVGDLRDEIAFLDAARTAMSAEDGRRTLEILRRYRDKYPAGSFRPEATAIKIETLMKLDRKAEARALAARFITENRGSLLSARVAELAGLAESSAAP